MLLRSSGAQIFQRATHRTCRYQDQRLDRDGIALLAIHCHCGFQELLCGTVEWAPGKSCLIYTWQVTSSSSIEGPLPIATAVAGWDETQERWTELSFSSNGGHQVLRYQLTEDDIWIGDGHGLRDGKEYSQKQTAEWVKGRDELLWKVTDLIIDGEKQEGVVA